MSLKGSAAALLYMDDQQKRVGTVTALVRPGDRRGGEHRRGAGAGRAGAGGDDRRWPTRCRRCRPASAPPDDELHRGFAPMA